ncbi:MAG: hypothetical protein VX817_00105 [Candidatus Thermoplasmatota archaeon]|jgi:predicted lipase|nr:hypothetical protein [Candidatus Thermoplasmatota archaeon]|tara:strand:+ start:549 stop:773 length:225 start_codon:yes stop_codon:yes gene_type:complete
MSEVDVLKERIKALEMEIEQLRSDQEKELNRIKSENYDALEASQTRYQGELEIQRTNFQRQIANLKAKMKSFEV